MVHSLFQLILLWYLSNNEIVPMRTIIAEKVIKEPGTVFGYLGLPHALTTDNSPQIISTEILWYLSNNEICHVTPKWAEANGEVQHFH